jgi:hypothetical protein
MKEKNSINTIPMLHVIMAAFLRPRFGRKAPRLLILVGLIALFFASYYMFQVFMLMPHAIEENEAGGILASVGMMLMMFAMYANYVLTIFRLSSGSRKAWAGMVRLSVIYTCVATLSTYGLSGLLPMKAAFAGSWEMWLIIVAVSAMMVYMFTLEVRKFFTPGYADEVPLREWAKYVFWIDPFKGENLIVEGPSS